MFQHPTMRLEDAVLFAEAQCAKPGVPAYNNQGQLRGVRFRTRCGKNIFLMRRSTGFWRVISNGRNS